eukprot:354254-Chlamydomonas_euryale.AAC.5
MAFETHKWSTSARTAPAVSVLRIQVGTHTCAAPAVSGVLLTSGARLIAPLQARYRALPAPCKRSARAQNCAAATGVFSLKLGLGWVETAMGAVVCVGWLDACKTPTSACAWLNWYTLQTWQHIHTWLYMYVCGSVCLSPTVNDCHWVSCRQHLNAAVKMKAFRMVPACTCLRTAAAAHIISPRRFPVVCCKAQLAPTYQLWQLATG